MTSYFSLQNKHPHIIYESIEKPRQLCGVLDNQLRNTNSRSKRGAAENLHETLHLHHSFHHHHSDHGHLDSNAADDDVNFSEHQIPKFSSVNYGPRSDSNLSHALGAGARVRRDVRYVPKFVETALVLDKAMVSETQYLIKHIGIRLLQMTYMFSLRVVDIHSKTN